MPNSSENKESELSANEPIKITQIIERFTQNVINRILNGAAHAGNIPYSYNTNMNIIKPEYLGSLNSIPTPIIGSKNSTINANTIYKGLIDITRYLLRVGTYTYSESKIVTGKWPHGAPSNCYKTISGKALFSDSFAANGAENSGRKLGDLDTAEVSPSPLQSPVVSTQIITASELIELMNRCYDAWNANNKPHYNAGHHTFCHSSCHSNCHSKCHSNDDYWDNGCNRAGDGCYGNNNHDNGCYHDGCWVNFSKK
mgnify:CR=1 FL=1